MLCLTPILIVALFLFLSMLHHLRMNVLIRYKNSILRATIIAFYLYYADHVSHIPVKCLFAIKIEILRNGFFIRFIGRKTTMKAHHLGEMVTFILTY